jgi:hypothetical protein
VARKAFTLFEGENKLSVDIRSLAKGSYYVNLVTADGKAQNAQKIIKN